MNNLLTQYNHYFKSILSIQWHMSLSDDTALQKYVGVFHVKQTICLLGECSLIR